MTMTTEWRNIKLNIRKFDQKKKLSKGNTTTVCVYVCTVQRCVKLMELLSVFTIHTNGTMAHLLILFFYHLSDSAFSFSERFFEIFHLGVNFISIIIYYYCVCDQCPLSSIHWPHNIIQNEYRTILSRRKICTLSIVCILSSHWNLLRWKEARSSWQLWLFISSRETMVHRHIVSRVISFD